LKIREFLEVAQTFQSAVPQTFSLLGKVPSCFSVWREAD